MSEVYSRLRVPHMHAVQVADYPLKRDLARAGLLADAAELGSHPGACITAHVSSIHV
jgi:hypothetical protein